jgi:hypothetical protein
MCPRIVNSWDVTLACCVRVALLAWDPDVIYFLCSHTGTRIGSTLRDRKHALGGSTDRVNFKI